MQTEHNTKAASFGCRFCIVFLFLVYTSPIMTEQFFTNSESRIEEDKGPAMRFNNLILELGEFPRGDIDVDKKTEIYEKLLAVAKELPVSEHQNLEDYLALIKTAMDKSLSEIGEKEDDGYSVLK